MVYLFIYIVGFVLSFLILEKVFKEDLRDKYFKAEIYAMIAIVSMLSWVYITAYFTYEKFLKNRV